MKLTNPTDDELNAAFAEKVAGFTMHLAPGCEWRRKELPRFIESIDAVLPWPEKWPWFEMNWGPKLGAYCQVDERPNPESPTHYGQANTLARAAVIALLRVHGVTVEFTQ